MGDGVYKISTLAKLTGFGIQAIRNWELRYGLLTPERTDGGHRLYSESDLQILLRVKALLAQGRSISEVAGLLKQEAQRSARAQKLDAVTRGVVTSLSKHTNARAGGPELDAALAIGVLNAVPHGIVLTDPEGKTEWINSGVTELCGYTFSDLEGRSPGSVLQGPDTDRKAVRRMAKALASRTSCSEELLNYDVKNRRYMAAVDVAPIWLGEKFRGFVGLIRDLTR